MFDSDLQAFLDLSHYSEQNEEMSNPDHYAILGLTRSVCCDPHAHKQSHETIEYQVLAPGTNDPVHCSENIRRHNIITCMPDHYYGAQHSQGGTQVVLVLPRG